MPEMINPLRYPGAKRTLINYIDELLEVNNLYGCTFIEPYAGSAVVGLKLLQRKHINTLLLCEKDVLLYAFWECVFNKTDELIEKIVDTPININTWHNELRFRKIQSVEETDILELGFAGLFFNRTNFSGILSANPIGGLQQTSQYSIDCRFNKSKIIDVISKISLYKNKVEVYCDDAIHFMQTQEKRFLKETCFAYFDPPYYCKGSKLYRHYYTNQGHIDLARYVRSIHNIDWIISYDDAPFICGLYSGSGAKYQPLFLDYTCSSKIRVQGKELLISNLPLPPFAMAKAIE